MNVLTANFLKIRKNRLFKWLFWVIPFGFFTLIDQRFMLNAGPESTIRLTIGCAFMVYLLIPYRKWIYIFLIQFILTFLFNFKLQFTIDLILTSSETITSLIAATIFVGINKSTIYFVGSNNILKILISAIVGSLVGGMVASNFLTISDRADFHPQLWITWTFASLTGILLMAPIIESWRSIKINQISGLVHRSMLELIVLIVSVLVVTHLIFNNKLNDIYLSISFPYLILPFIFWAAIRFHPRILSLLLFVDSFLILYYTDIGTLPFRQAGQPFQLIVNSVQVFILFTVVFSHIMAGIIHVRREAEMKVKRLNEDLEERVLERTKALQHTLGALRQSEEQFREAFDTSIHGMALISLKGGFLRVNQAFCDMIGYSIEKLGKSNLRKITHPDDYLLESRKFKKLIKDEVPSYQIEKRLIQKDDLTVWVLESNSLIKNQNGEPLHIVSQIVDITERKQVEGQLRKYTETLTVLLREVNHRVKNNLSALIGILHMEEERAIKQGEEGYIQLLRDVNSRIRSLATVHSMLSAGNWQPLEISQLGEQIIQAVLKGLPFDRNVSLQVDKTGIKISSNQAHHLTLVINELATNSVKYGLVDRTDGLIQMRIQESIGNIHIIFQDNGPGYPEFIIQGDFRNASIGFELIRGIVTQSLDGNLILRNENGAVTEILFANELS